MKITPPSFTINTVNSNRLHEHFDSLMDNYSKLLPLRLDFHYNHMANKRYQDAYSDMFLLYHLYRLSNNTGIVGFAFSIEYSQSKRLHIHSVFYINAQKHQQYYTFFQSLNEIWASRISDAGHMHCCNSEQNYINNGLVKIDFTDTKTQQHLKYALNYMGKTEQKESIPLFYQVATSCVLPKSNRGRPRLI